MRLSRIRAESIGRKPEHPLCSIRLLVIYDAGEAVLDIMDDGDNGGSEVPDSGRDSELLEETLERIKLELAPKVIGLEEPCDGDG